MIQRLQLRNFRSFKELDLELRPLNVVVGANASGKTNLVQAFRFLRDLAQHGLENAVSLQGGVEYLTNLNSRERELEIKVFYTPRFTLHPPKESELPALHVEEICHDLRIRTVLKSRSARIVRETLEIHFWHPGTEAIRNTLKLRRENARVNIETIGDSKLFDFIVPKRRLFRLPPTVSLTQFTITLFLLIPPPFFDQHTAIYDFLPKLAKQAVPISSEFSLSEDGQNLPLVIQHILRSPKQRDRLLKQVQLILPYVKQLQVSTPIGQHVALQVQEAFFDKRNLPAALLSDGTVEVVALIVALFFSRSQGRLLIFEEPDRNLHPAVMSALVELLRDASETNQILITTHNPELVRRTQLDELILVERDNEGNSVVKRPAEMPDVKIFLEEQLGLDYLFVQNLLGA
jgi:predicted ATPase